jgi:hypothetical protein
MKWLLLIVLFPLPALSQDVQLLSCARVSFFEPACPAEMVPLPPPPLPPPPAPFFPPATLARDTPPLMLQLLETPTLENAKAFIAWQQQRLQRIAEVQQLLHTLTHAPQPDEKE